MTVWSVVYAVGQISLGEFLHPYQTMQLITAQKIYAPLALLPSLLLSILTVFWRIIFVPTVSLLFSCRQTELWVCDWLPFLATWIIFYCVLWQVMLLYLYYRFSVVVEITE